MKPTHTCYNLAEHDSTHTTMPIILPIAAATLIVSFALLTVALRGKRAGTEPRCRKCNYDLTGIASIKANAHESTNTSPTTSNAQGSRSLGDPSINNRNHQSKTTSDHDNQAKATTHCPECRHPLVDSKGNPTTRKGKRRTKPKLLAASILLLISASAGITIGVRQHLSRVNSWLELMPHNIVITAAERGITGAADELAERLPRRANFNSSALIPPPDNPLSSEQISRVIDAVISSQKNATSPWMPEWQRLAAGLLLNEDHWTDEQITEFLKHTIKFSVIVPPRVHAGKPFSVVLLIESSDNAPIRPFNHIDTSFGLLYLGLDIYTGDQSQHQPPISRGGGNYFMFYNNAPQLRLARTITTDTINAGPAPGQYNARVNTAIKVTRPGQRYFNFREHWPLAIEIDLPFTINVVDPSEPIAELRTIDECPNLMQSLRAVSIHISGGINDYEILSIDFANLPHHQPLEASLVGRIEFLIEGQRIPFDNNFATLNDELPSANIRWHRASTQALNSINHETGQREPSEVHDQHERVIRKIYTLYSPERLRFAAEQQIPSRLLLEQYHNPTPSTLPATIDVIYTPVPSLASRLAPSAPAVLNEPLIFKDVPLRTNYEPVSPYAATQPQPLED